MKTTVTQYHFIDSQALKDNFTYYGRIALFEYFEQLGDDLDTQIEFDPIAIRCEFTEYSDLDEIKEVYPDIESLEDLYDYTQVIEFDNVNEFMQGRTSGIIIQDF